MSLTTAGGASILTPEQVDQLVVRPFSQESVTMRVGTVYHGMTASPHVTRQDDSDNDCD